MAKLIANLPVTRVNVLSKFLTQDKDDKNIVEGYWVSVKSIPGEAFRFETYIPEYAAVYDKLPISAFVSNVGDFHAAVEEYTYQELQMWECFSYDITVLEKSFISDMRVKAALLVNGKTVVEEGNYMYTIDSYHSGDEVNTTLALDITEHKSFNIIRLDMGQFAALPNNRVQFFDDSLTPPDAKIPTHWNPPTERLGMMTYNKKLGHAEGFTYNR